jgi:hypothetical protein
LSVQPRLERLARGGRQHLARQGGLQAQVAHRPPHSLPVVQAEALDAGVHRVLHRLPPGTVTSLSQTL